MELDLTNIEYQSKYDAINMLLSTDKCIDETKITTISNGTQTSIFLIKPIIAKVFLEYFKAKINSKLQKISEKQSITDKIPLSQGSSRSKSLTLVQGGPKSSDKRPASARLGGAITHNNGSRKSIYKKFRRTRRH